MKKTVRLKESTLSRTARESGKPLEDLKLLLALADTQGRKISVTYEVKEKK